MRLLPTLALASLLCSSALLAQAPPAEPPTRTIRLGPTTGGAARTLAASDDRAPAWSPDGRRVAFQRSVGTDSVGFHELVLAIANVDGTELRLYPDAPSPMDPRPLPAPVSWSPDGRWIAYRTRLTAEVRDRIPVGAHHPALGPGNAIVVLSVESGEARVLASTGNTLPIFWTEDSAAVIYVCAAVCRPVGEGQGSNAWESPVTGGPRRDLGAVPGNNSVPLAGGEWVGASGRRLLRTQASATGEVLLDGIAPALFGSSGFPWAVTRDGERYAGLPVDDDGEPTGVLRIGERRGGAVDVPLGATPMTPLVWHPDGSRVFVRVRDGVRFAIFAVAADGSTVERVTPPGERIVADFALSPDGSTLAYASGAALFSYRALVYALDGAPPVNGDELWALHLEIEEIHAHLPGDDGWDLQWLDPGADRYAWILAEALAESGVRFAEAEAAVREGLELRERSREERPIANVERYAQWLDQLHSASYAAIGWIRFHAGDLDGARRELERAFEARNDDPGILYKLGRVWEAAGDVERAEGWFALGSSVEQRGDDYRGNLRALERLYAGRTGSLAGFDGYLAAIDAREASLVVAFDEGHFNVHSLRTPYSEFGRVAGELGFVTRAHPGPFTAVSLQGVHVLVACCARATDVGPLAARGNPAHLREELDVVEQWVRDGGALLLVIDHFPIGGANQALAARFGVEVVDGYTEDRSMGEPIWAALPPPDTAMLANLAIVFERSRGQITDHPITCGRSADERIDRVATFPWGGSLNAPSGSAPLLLLSDQARDLVGGLRPPDLTGLVTSAAGRNQGVALVHGSGRVVVLGEARMLYDLDQPNLQNRQFAANLLRWLAGEASSGAEGCRGSTSGTAETTAAQLPAPVKGYPTTLFLDREGRIQYWVMAPRPRLAEEYGWRVEALLGERSGAGPRSDAAATLRSRLGRLVRPVRARVAPHQAFAERFRDDPT